MWIKFSPQVNSAKVVYTVKESILTAEVDEDTFTIDFTHFPDGKMQEPFSPVFSAYKKNNEVFVTITTPYEEPATHEVKFPPEEYREMDGVIYTNLVEEQEGGEHVE